MLGRWLERVRVLDNQVVESVVCVILDNCKQCWLRMEGNVSNKHAEGEGRHSLITSECMHNIVFSLSSWRKKQANIEMHMYTTVSA